MSRLNRTFRGFTLVELLVVIGIIALLISILMPALRKAREAAVKITCASQLRQVALIWHTYANDNKGYFPPVNWGNPHMLEAFAAGTGPERQWDGWMDSYIKRAGRKILQCPDQDPKILELGKSLPQAWRYLEPQVTPIYWSTYFFVAGTGNRLPGNGVMNGRILYLNSTRAYPRAPVTRMQDCGKEVTSYGVTSDYYGPMYVQSVTEQPLATDMSDFSDGRWVPHSLVLFPPRNNHKDGQNIVYVDGHAEWKDKALLQPRYRAYYDHAWW